MSLGVVIPCYRQEAYLPRTIAALEAALEGRAWRGVLVMSTPGADPGVALGEHWRVIAPPVSTALTPGAARMLGFAACGGEYVLFVDADVEVETTWIEEAMARLGQALDVAGLWGRLEEWFSSAEGERMGSPDLLRVGDAEREVDYITALALYRRDALLRAGGYDARLRSEEDFELGLRLRRTGARLVSLGMRAGRHWSAPRPSFPELSRRWRAGLCFGQGQVLRLYLGRPGFSALLRRQSLYVGVLAVWVAGLAAVLIAAIGRNAAPLLACFALAACAFLFMALRKRSAKSALYSFLTWNLNAAGMIVGLLRGPESRMTAREGGRA